jgi:hypothetical protein
MSSLSEQDSIDPDNPKLDYTPFRLSERAAKLGPLVSQGARSEPIISSPLLLPASLAPKAIDEPARRTHDLDRRAALLGGATAVAGVIAVAALLFVTMKPTSRQSIGSPTPFEITGSTPQSNQEDAESMPALAEFKAPVTSLPSQADEQSPQLLQRFLQWREKSNTTEASQ